MALAGDVLARGAASAEFESGGRKLEESRYDRRVLSKEEFLEKWDLTPLNASDVSDDAAYEVLHQVDEMNGDWPELKVKEGYVPPHLRNLKTEPKEPVVIDRRPKYEKDPLETAVWTKELIQSLTPQQHLYRYKEDPRYWEAFHKLTPPPSPGQPLGDTVIMERIPEKRHFLDQADAAAQKPLQCLVIAASKKAQEYGIEAGSRVMIRSYTGTGITVNGYDYEVLSYHDILFVMKQNLF